MATLSSGPVVVGAEHLQVSFDAAVPAAVEIDPGTVVAFETSDAIFRRLATGESLAHKELQQANAVTGPVGVRRGARRRAADRGARRGDRCRLDREDGGLRSPRRPVDGIRVTPARVESGRVFVADDVHVPFDPMVGCIGVAPSRGAASTLRPVYPTGGNLDLRELSPGSVLWLPVAVAGALLSVGDLHAAMGRGEPAFIAIEGSGTATLRIDIEQRSKLTLPRIRTAEGTVVVGMGESFPSARQSAVEQAYAVLTDDHGLPPEAAYAYVCARVELRFAGLSGSMVEGMEAVAALVPDPHQREATDSQPVPQTRVHGAHCDRRPLPQWLSLSVPAASRLAPRSRCQCWPAARHSGQSELVEAVAQTVKMRSGVRPGVRSKLLRVGSEIGHRIRQATPVRVDAVAPSPSDAHLSERAAAFPRRLYATASMESDSGPRP